MFVLVETAAGFALFQLLKPKKLKKLDKIPEYFSTPEKASQVVNLVAFQKFKDTQDAVKAMEKTVKGKVAKSLKKLLKSTVINKEVQQTLHLQEKKLAQSINTKLGIECKHGEISSELIRGIRSQLDTLLPNVKQNEMNSLALGLSHSYSRYKLKMTSDKLDIMIIQAICLLEDLDKQLNNYAMRLKQWYSWHFPELAKIVGDNVVFARLVNTIGMRQKADQIDLSQIVPEGQTEKEIKEAARNSMGTQILDADVLKLRYLAQQVIQISSYRAELNTYLKNRMKAVAPSLSNLVGEQVGAKLISHAGSLMNLAKMAASTVQILGAEKALFRAIKKNQNTPKYGLIYHASIVGNAPPRLKGKISRSLAAKAALCIRCDALGEDEEGKLGKQCNYYMEKKLNKLKEEEASAPGQSKTFQRFQFQKPSGYNPGNDFVSAGTMLGSRGQPTQSQEEPKVKKSKKHA